MIAIISQSKDSRFCYVCKRRVVNRTEHCRICNKCIERYDHHCKWLNTCIGKKNYKQESFFRSMQIFLFPSHSSDSLCFFYIRYILNSVHSFLHGKRVYTRNAYNSSLLLSSNKSPVFTSGLPDIPVLYACSHASSAVLRPRFTNFPYTVVL